MKINAREIINNYPKLKVKDRKGKLFEMSDDLFFLSINGKIERITSCIITERKLKKRTLIELEIKSSDLVDKGICEVEKCL